MPSRRPCWPIPAARRPTRRPWSTVSWAWPWRSRAGDAAPVRVATTGVFELDCASATFELGDLVGPDSSGAANTLLNQQAIKVNAGALAIGRVAKRQPVAATSVLVDIRSTVMTGGVREGRSSGA